MNAGDTVDVHHGWGRTSGVVLSITPEVVTVEIEGQPHQFGLDGQERAPEGWTIMDGYSIQATR